MGDKIEKSNLMSFEEFKKKAEPNFFKPVIFEFEFLVKNHNFTFKGNCSSYESSIIYIKDAISITIFHAFPEPPSLILEYSISGKIKEKKVINKPLDSSKKYARELEYYRDNVEIEEWCKNFRSAAYEKPFTKVIQSYSAIIKSNIDEIITGNFDFKR